MGAEHSEKGFVAGRDSYDYRKISQRFRLRRFH
jgi:hypothetical protein